MTRIQLVKKAMLMLAFLATQTALAAGWEAVQRISPDRKVQVVLRDGKDIHGRFVSASDTALVVRSRSGEQALPRQDVRKVRVADQGRRVRNGLIWTGIGAAAGVGIGFAICPHCGNEGAGAKYTAPVAAGGAGLGAAAGFLLPAHRTIYKVE